MNNRLINSIRSVIDLSGEEINLLNTYWKEKRLKKNDFLFRNGDVCRYDNFVLSGALKAYFIHPETGREQILYFAIEDWWATDLNSFATQTPSIYNVQAIKNTTILQIHYQSFEMMLRKIPKLERYFRLILQSYTGSIQKRIIYNNAYDAKYRYRDFAKEYPKIIQKIPQYLIASYLGITPEFLSRIRAKKL